MKSAFAVTSVFVTTVLIALSVVSLEVCAQNMEFDEHPIDTNFQGMSCVVVFDLDNDGDKDLIGGSEWTPWSTSIGLAWWRNDGGDPISWTRFTVDLSFSNVMSVEVAYVDNDAYPDIVATSWDLHQIAWWKNSGYPVVGWSKRVIRSGFTNAHDAECVDINQDGFTDVVGTCSTPGNVMVCYHDGSDPPSWSFQTLSTTFYGGKSVTIHDLDHDGDPDIVGTAADANRVTWWENRGGNPVNWFPRTITTSLQGSHDVDVVHMNGDSLYDLIATGYIDNEVSYWLCIDLAGNQWFKTVVTGQLDMAVKALGGDFDRDGDVDIVAIGKIPGELNVYENENYLWTPTNLEQNFNGGWALATDDLDDDGDLDIIAGASARGALLWWENKGTVVDVMITSFTAEARATDVKIEWAIERDEEIKGYRLYKCIQGDQVYEPVGSASLIPEHEDSYVDTDVLPGRTYQYCLAVVKEDGSETRSQIATVKTYTKSLILNQNYPNPFNPTTAISFSLPQKAHANLSIFDLEGRLVTTLVDGVLNGGYQDLTWDGTDARGNPVSSGVYFYRLKAGKNELIRKMVLIK